MSPALVSSPVACSRAGTAGKTRLSMADDRPVESQPDGSFGGVDRSTRGAHRVPAPRQNASPREVERFIQLLVARELRERPDIDYATARRNAERRWEEMRRNPRLVRAMQTLAPTSRAPDRNEVHWIAELAAAAALPPVSRVMQQLALTPRARGPASELSGAVASIFYMAATSGACNALTAFDQFTSGCIAMPWAFGFPVIAPSHSQCYRNVKTITGDEHHDGHDAGILVATNLELLRQLKPLHPRIGEVAIVDITRLAAPVRQLTPASEEHLQALRRPDMANVESILYEHNGQYDNVNGWKGAVLIDQATNLPLVWTVARGKAYEPDILLNDLLPTLFSRWPGCPLGTLIGDAFYDTEPVCRELVERWSIQPIFTRHTPRTTVRTLRGGSTVTVIDGRPQCPTCGPMKFVRREGFYTADARNADGKSRGEIVADIKKARTRWECRCGLYRDVSLYAKDNYRDHTFWPRDDESKFGFQRRAYELYRNGVESTFARVKQRGIGTRDGRCLWARDSGIAVLLGSEQLLHTGRRVAHESGAYHFLHDEYLELGLNLSGEPPSRAQMHTVAQRRPPDLKWEWPTPGRAARSHLQNAA